ncbi:MAG: pentapeptide repeat-containing protein, partial [Roseococcus sp.]
MAKTAEELQKQWWDRWWAADWSWEGLADKPVGKNGNTIHGGVHGEQTLQEYWRRDPKTQMLREDSALLAAGELVQAPDGELWHLAHVPMHWPGGTPAKGGWDAARREVLASIIAARMAEADETQTDGWCGANRPDRRAQLSGTVLLDAPRHPMGEGFPLDLVCDHAALPGWRAPNLEFGAGFTCAGANFFNDTDLNGAAFSADSNFNAATFCGYARFHDATFAGTARFYAAAFLGSVSFGSATFSKGADFDNANFSGGTSFTSTTFATSASFTKATF